MGETEKPFACDMPGCGVRFVSVDRLTSHRKRHHMELSLECENDGSERSVVEQTPTPTRFLDSELFQDFRSGLTPEPVQGLQSVNPFEEDFRRGAQAASQGTLLIHESGHEASDSLNTPCIPPVTADPLRAPALPILPSSSSPPEKNIDAVQPAATSQDTGDETSPFMPSTKEHDEVPHKPTRKDSTSRSRPEKLRLRLSSEISDTATESSSPEPSKDLSAGASKHRTPVITSLRFIQNQTMGNPAAMSILKDVTPDIVTTAQPVSSLPKTSIIAAPAASVIQIPGNVQLLIVSNPAVTSTVRASVPVAAPPRVPQQDARMKLKEALSSRSQSSNLPSAFVTTPSENCTLSITSPLCSEGRSTSPCGRRRKQDDDHPDDERKKKTREINRFAAQRSRERKKKQNEDIRRQRDMYKQMYEDLREKVTKVMAEKADLKQENIKLRQTIQELKWQSEQLNDNPNASVEQNKVKSVIHQTATRTPSNESGPANVSACPQSVIISNASNSTSSVVHCSSNTVPKKVCSK